LHLVGILFPHIKLSVVDCPEMIAVEWLKSVDAAASDDPIVPVSYQTGY